MEQHNFIENELVILTKQTLDIFLKEQNASDLIALYTFYYYTAKWQKTNQPKCTTQYTATGLHWTESKVRKTKKQLIEYGLIEDAQAKDASGKIAGHYIKMNYIFKKETEQKTIKNHTVENPQGGIKHTVADDRTNALSTDTLNALSPFNENALSTDNKKERKKAQSGYDEILSSVVDADLRDLFYEYIKMRKMIKAPMTDRALNMLISKVYTLEPNSIDGQKQVLENAIMNSWKSVYPLKDEKPKSSTGSSVMDEYRRVHELFNSNTPMKGLFER